MIKNQYWLKALPYQSGNIHLCLCFKYLIKTFEERLSRSYSSLKTWVTFLEDSENKEPVLLIVTFISWCSDLYEGLERVLNNLILKIMVP